MHETFCTFSFLSAATILLLILASSHIEVHFVKKMFDATHSYSSDERQLGSQSHRAGRGVSLWHIIACE